MRSLVLSTTALMVTFGLVTACGDAAPRSAERFCGELQAHADEITNPPATPDAAPALVTLFSKMDEVAPLEIQSDWEAVYGSLKTAITVNVNDPASVQKVADASYASQRSAQKVAQWAKDTCAIDLGPVGTAPAGVAVAPPPSATATTG